MRASASLARAGPPASAPAGSRLVPPTLASFRYSLPIQTRVADMDTYGHMNNTKYMELIDTAINTMLSELHPLSP